MLDLILRKHGLSDSEVAVELVREISKHDTSNGIFHLDIRAFQKENQAINHFILEVMGQLPANLTKHAKFGNFIISIGIIKCCFFSRVWRFTP